MKISELIKELEYNKEVAGDVEIVLDLVGYANKTFCNVPPYEKSNGDLDHIQTVEGYQIFVVAEGSPVGDKWVMIRNWPY
jgi:hypothetical protein